MKEPELGQLPHDPPWVLVVRRKTPQHLIQPLRPLLAPALKYLPDLRLHPVQLRTNQRLLPLQITDIRHPNAPLLGELPGQPQN
jgi:hypothetical protein